MPHSSGQPTVAPSSRLDDIVLGLGVSPEHLNVVEAHPRNHVSNVEVIRDAMRYEGLSVIIAHRECIMEARRRKQSDKAVSS